MKKKPATPVTPEAAGTTETLPAVPGTYDITHRQGGAPSIQEDTDGIASFAVAETEVLLEETRDELMVKLDQMDIQVGKAKKALSQAGEKFVLKYEKSDKALKTALAKFNMDLDTFSMKYAGIAYDVDRSPRVQVNIEMDISDAFKPASKSYSHDVSITTQFEPTLAVTKAAETLRDLSKRKDKIESAILEVRQQLNNMSRYERRARGAAFKQRAARNEDDKKFVDDVTTSVQATAKKSLSRVKKLLAEASA